MKNILIDKLNEGLPSKFPVAVIMQQSPAASDWCEYDWKAIGIAALNDESAGASEMQLIHEAGSTRQYLLSGFDLLLHKDECESYYHNLMSPSPGCYVVAHQNEAEMPEPFLVTMSFDEAHAYLEGDEEIYAVDIPAELYRWVESYVLIHYAQEERKKRKRKDWKKPEQPYGIA